MECRPTGTFSTTKFPSMSVTAPIVMPFSTVIVTPIMGSPDATSQTCPLTTCVACALIIEGIISNNNAVVAPKNIFVIFLTC